MSDTIGKLFRSLTPKPGKQAVPELSVPTPTAFQPPPTLSAPALEQFQPPPQLSTPTPPAAQPPPTLRVPRTQPDQTSVFHQTDPDPVPFEAPPKLSAPAAISTQPAPVLSVPTTIPTQQPPVLTAPGVIPTEPPPVLKAPAVIPFEPAPVLSAPAIIPTEPAPPAVAPPVIPLEPAQALTTPAVIPLEPAPALTTPAVIPLEAPPALTAPATIPLEPAPVLTAPVIIPLEPPPVLTAPDPVDPGPLSTPGPPLYSDSNIVNAVGGIGVNLPPPLGAISAPVALNIGINPHSGLPTVKLDIHLSEIPGQIRANVESFAQAQANIVAQRALTAATGYVNSALRDVKTQAEKAIVSTLSDLNPFSKRGGATTIQEAAADAPGGKRTVPIPPPDPGKPSLPHRSPSETVIDAFDVPAADPDFTYASDTRQAAQLLQEVQARVLDEQVDQANSWNDNFAYGEVQSSAISTKLQQANGATQKGLNPLSGLIQSDAGTDERGYYPFNGSQQTLPNDDEIYVPLVFTDLRPNRQQFRAVYFRPFIKNLSENFAPQWNLGNYFGRVDPVATYKSTDRTISLGFKVTCFSPEDLAANYRKLAWLTSMCYPEYEGSAYFAGPVIRLRVGDVISAVGGATGKGLSGIITSLDINYDEATWELQSGMKLPRDIDVSVGFHVLHDRAVGITRTNAGMQFGGYANGTADVRKFRAAFGSTDYINDTPAAPGTTQVPAIVPLSANPLSGDGGFPTSPTMLSNTDGQQPSTPVNDFGSFPSSNADGGLGAV